jgi:hypothetical protein
MAVHDQILSQPASEVTVLDPANGHVLDRDSRSIRRTWRRASRVPARGWS